MKQDNKERGTAGDSPKRHGDKLDVGTEPALEKRDAQPSGDSPKHQGDKLEHAAREAAGQPDPKR